MRVEKQARKTRETAPEAITPDANRAEELKRARRTSVPIRNIFVQLPYLPEAGPDQERGSVLGRMVTRHQDRALDAYMLRLALQPALAVAGGEDEALHSAVWARLLSTDTDFVPEASVSRTWLQLEKLGLIKRARRQRMAVVTPLLEDASGDPYSRPGEDVDALQGDDLEESAPATNDDVPNVDAEDLGERDEVERKQVWSKKNYYFNLPHGYWLDGHHARLSLPGKALLLVALQATGGKKQDFYLPYDRGPQWYGVSPETVERGLRELRGLKLLTERHERIPASRAPKGYTIRTHYTPTGEFSSGRRKLASKRAVAANKRRLEAKAAKPA